jgi:hypothetical protein
MMIARNGAPQQGTGRTIMIVGAVRRIIVMIARRHRISLDFAAPQMRIAGDRRRRSR